MFQVFLDPQVKLGKREIDALTCPPGRQDVLVMDGELTGFGIRVSHTGTKIFLFQYRFGSLIRRLRLGIYGPMTPGQARKLAEVARGRVAAGGDPVGERQAVHQATAAAVESHRVMEAADALTFEALVGRWSDGALLDRSPGYRHEATRCLRTSLAPLLSIPAGRIEAGDLQAELDRIGRAHPTTARRVRAYGRAMFGWAMKRRLVQADPFSVVVAEGRETSRDRVLSDIELGEAWRAASAMEQPFGPYLRLLILTLQRRAEVAGMRWDELDADLTCWTLPASRAKNRKAHLVHLAPAARAVLVGIARRIDPATGAASRFVFTTTGRTPISGFQNAKEQLDRLVDRERTDRDGGRAKAGHGAAASIGVTWRLHDLRRTGVTTLARLGVPPHVADRLLNHVQGTIRGVAAVYQRHDFLAERETALTAWAAHVVAVASVGSTEASPFVGIMRTRRRRSTPASG